DNKGIFKFSIKDTGIGIKKDERERMFQAFTQADGSTTRKYGGTGLGLTISNMLLSKLNSHIEFESEPDKGSEFFFEIEAEYFTKEKKETLSEKIEPENLTQNFSYSKILIAEDYEPNFLLLEALISKKIPGSEIIKATNGKEAYEKTFEFYPDIILMDVQMPEMDGIEATKTIRANADTSDITIIALTAHAFENEKEKCLEAGMNDFISKPVDINTVIEKIIYYLNNGATE
ncbi:MAG: response regulator, partial [Candidatus Muiribacteriota bacterium]